MIGTSNIPFPPWALFFCFTPLMVFWFNEKSVKRILLSGWITQFICTLIGFHWIAHTIHEFGPLPWPIALLGLFAYCCFASLHIPLAGLVWALFFKDSPKKWVKVLSMTLCLAGGERIFPMIFDWHLGYAWLGAGFPAFNLADLIGFSGLSTINWFFQGLFLYSWVSAEGVGSARKLSPRKFWGLAFSVLIFLLLNLLGYLHRPDLKQDHVLKVSIIQANIGNLEKQLAEKGHMFRQYILDQYLSLSRREVVNQPDFLLWPETAFPDYLTPAAYVGSYYGAQVKNFLKSNNAHLLTGTYGISTNGKMTNSIVALDGDGFVQEPYNKTHLLAFGEFIPGSHLFPVFKKWLPMVADFERGPGPTVMKINGVSVGVQICYESMFDRFARAQAQEGAVALVNVTNDSWFGKWPEPIQHLTVTVARAIETRLPLIRSTNTGISTVELPDGKTLERSPIHQAWSHTYEIPYTLTPAKTVFTGFGYWVFPVLLVALFIWVIIKRN